MTKKARGKSSGKPKKKALPTKTPRKGKSSVAVAAKQRPKPPAKSKTPKSIPRNPERVSGVQPRGGASDTQRVLFTDRLGDGIQVEDVRAVVRDELKKFRVALVKSLRDQLRRYGVADISAKHSDARVSDAGSPGIPTRSDEKTLSDESRAIDCEKNNLGVAGGDDGQSDSPAPPSDDFSREKDVAAEYKSLCSHCKRPRGVLVAKVEEALCGLLENQCAIPGAGSESDFNWKIVGSVRTRRKVRELLKSLELVTANIKPVTKILNGPKTKGRKSTQETWTNTRLTANGAKLAQYIQAMKQRR
jgi:hypothetical protein